MPAVEVVPLPGVTEEPARLVALKLRPLAEPVPEPAPPLAGPPETEDDVEAAPPVPMGGLTAMAGLTAAELVPPLPVMLPLVTLSAPGVLDPPHPPGVGLVRPLLLLLGNCMLLVSGLLLLAPTGDRDDAGGATVTPPSCKENEK